MGVLKPISSKENETKTSLNQIATNPHPWRAGVVIGLVVESGSSSVVVT